MRARTDRSDQRRGNEQVRQDRVVVARAEVAPLPGLDDVDDGRADEERDHHQDCGVDDRAAVEDGREPDESPAQLREAELLLEVAPGRPPDALGRPVRGEGVAGEPDQAAETDGDRDLVEEQVGRDRRNGSHRRIGECRDHAGEHPGDPKCKEDHRHRLLSPPSRAGGRRAPVVGRCAVAGADHGRRARTPARRVRLAVLESSAPEPVGAPRCGRAPFAAHAGPPQSRSPRRSRDHTHNCWRMIGIHGHPAARGGGGGRPARQLHAGGGGAVRGAARPLGHRQAARGRAGAAPLRPDHAPGGAHPGRGGVRPAGGAGPRGPAGDARRDGGARRGGPGAAPGRRLVHGGPVAARDAVARSTRPTQPSR